MQERATREPNSLILGEIEATSQKSSADNSMEYRFSTTTDYVASLGALASVHRYVVP